MAITKFYIPLSACNCNINSCVYNKGGICDEPRINRSNSDSSCHKMVPKKLLTHLTKIKK